MKRAFDASRLTLPALAIALLFACGSTTLQGEEKAKAKSGTLLVCVPAEAAVYVNGEPTKSQGVWRQFASKTLSPEGHAVFDVRVVARQNGQEVVETKSALVAAGETAYLFFGLAAAAAPDGRIATGDEVRVMIDGATMGVDQATLARLARGQKLPVLRVRDGWVWTAAEQNGRKVEGWIPGTWVAPVRSTALAVNVRRPIAPEPAATPPKPAPAAPLPTALPPAAPAGRPAETAAKKYDPFEHRLPTAPPDNVIWNLPSAPSADDLAELEKWESRLKPDILFVPKED